MSVDRWTAFRFWRRRRQVCVDCHFFTKEVRTLPNGKSVTLEMGRAERSLAHEGDFSWAQDHWTLCCHQGVWDEGHGTHVEDRRQTICETDHRGFCFFWPHHDGMFLQPAKVLQQREAEARQANRDRRLTKTSLVIAAIGLIANALLQIAEALNWWPF